MIHRPWTRTVDLVHTVLVDRLHRSKGYAIWSVDSEMDGSGGLGCFTWPEQGSGAVAAITGGENLAGVAGYGDSGHQTRRDRYHSTEEGKASSPS